MFAPWIAAGFLFLALLPGLPFGYYQIMRWVVCGASCYGAFNAKKKEKSGWIWAFIAIAVVFNPLLPIHFNRRVWQILDLVGAIMFLFSAKIFERKMQSS